MNIIETHALSKSYGSATALRDCTLAIPEGHVVALVGPNGAGKSTLLNLSVGLAAPSAGEVTVLGGLRAGSAPALDGIAFVAQDTPLFKNLSAADLLHMTRNLNLRFDQGYAEERLGELGIPVRQKAGKMSGGQQAQLALTLALARRPRLLVLDEPMAMLDPLARHDFMATVMTAVADDGVSVVLSSHVLAELERVADYLVLVSRGSVQVAGEVDDLLATHRVLTGPAAESGWYASQWDVVHASCAEPLAHLLVRGGGAADPVPPGWEAHHRPARPGHQPVVDTARQARRPVRPEHRPPSGRCACRDRECLPTRPVHPAELRPRSLPPRARLQPGRELPARQLVLALPMDRGRLAAGALRTPRRRGDLAGPTTGDLGPPGTR